ncbi:hypothetical protein MMC13_001928 [Lambiella insularis]|nr:hypothetical protein [Lambiella insularis]
MSYNGYNYSPYYPHQAQVTRDNTQRPSHQSDNTGLAYYRSSADVPTQRTHSGPISYGTNPSSENYGSGYSHQGYRPANDSRNDPQQGSKDAAQPSTTYYDSNTRSYMDKSALGNLAYASALGKDGNSVDHNASAQYRGSDTVQHRDTTHSSYAPRTPAMAGYTQPRSDSRGSNTAKTSTGQDNPVSPYVAAIAANALAQTQNTSRHISPQTQYRPDQSSSHSTHTTGQGIGYMAKGTEHTLTSSTQYAPSLTAAVPLRISQSQTIPSRESSASNAPPHKVSVQQGQTGAILGYNGTSQHGGIYNTSSSQRLDNPARPPATTRPDDRNGQSHDRKTSSTNVSSSHSAQSSRQNNTPQGYSSDGHAHPHDIIAGTATTPSASKQHPTTVDPNRVFNFSEYHRRKAEAEAEAAKKTADQRKAMSTERISHTNTTPAELKQPANASSASEPKQSITDNGSKDQIEAEIKAMIEKMREYKSKDPAVFSEVWERFKQVQPPPRSSSQIPQTSKEPQSATFPSDRDSGIASPGFMDNASLPSPSPVLTQVATMPEGGQNTLPDLGKFPFQRRRRREENGKQKGSNLGTVIGTGNYISSDIRHATLDPSLSGIAITSTSQGTESMALQSDTYGEETMRQAMQAFSEAAKVGKFTTPSDSPYLKQTQTQSQTSSGTIWPEEKKTSVALVAKRTLESSAANTGKSISVDTIRSILNTNPSYDQLCQRLGSLGFSIERAEFARLLLDAIPNGQANAATPVKTPRSTNKPRHTPASDSPRRPRGRPRRDGLPQRQNINKQTPNVLDATWPSVPATQATKVNEATSGSGIQSASAAVEDHGDQNLASALKSAITQIDNQTSQLNTSILQNAIGTSYTLHRPSMNGGSALEYAAGDAAREALRWSPNRQFSAERLQLENRIDPQTGRLTTRFTSTPLANGIHPGFGVMNFAAPQIDVSQTQNREIYPASHIPPTGALPVPASSIPPAETAPTPVSTKEQIARKRNFSEIVDLTLDEDEEDTEQRKKARVAQINGDVAHIFPNATYPIKSLAQTAAPLSSGVSTAASATKQDLSQFRYVSAGLIADRESLRSANLVDELSKNNARKKSTYNIKTLARDILISKGIHPTEKPLNWHLNPLRDNFRSVNYNSDLSTFRWDLVDPGGPQIPQAVEHEAKAQDAKDEAEGLPTSSTSIPIRSTPIRSTPIRSTPIRSTPNRGRPRGRPPLNRGAIRGSHVFSSNAKPLEQTRNGSYSRQNAVDVVGDPSANLMSPPSNPVNGGSLTSTNLAGSMGKASNGRQDIVPSRYAVDGSADSPMALTARTPSTYSLSVRIPPSPVQVQVEEKTGSHLGRLPGSVDRSSIAKTPRSDFSAPRPRGRPRGSKNGVPSRGRPSNRGRTASHRTEVPPDGIGVLLPSRSPSTSSRLSHVESTPDAEKRKKGRPSRQATSPSFQVFKCQWQGCGAELHNLATLRKHIFKVHGTDGESEGEAGLEAVNRKIPCLWVGCRQEGIFSSTTGILKFADRDSWMTHVEKRHLETVAWELGDGPSTNPSDVEPSSYLSDSRGRQITPLARTEGRPDPLPPGSGPSPTRAYHRAHKNITQHQKSQAELNSQVATKEVAGVFVGQNTDEYARPQQQKKLGIDESDSDESSE